MVSPYGKRMQFCTREAAGSTVHDRRCKQASRLQVWTSYTELLRANLRTVLHRLKVLSFHVPGAVPYKSAGMQPCRDDAGCVPTAYSSRPRGARVWHSRPRLRRDGGEQTAQECGIEASPTQQRPSAMSLRQLWMQAVPYSAAVAFPGCMRQLSIQLSGLPPGQSAP